MNNLLSNHQEFKKKIIHEVHLYFMYTFFLTLLLSVFVTYERLLLREYVNISFHYGYSLVEALILAKVILIGERIKLGERYAVNRPLIYPVIYKTILFCLLLFIFSIIEYIIGKWLDGKNLTEIVESTFLLKLDVILAKTLVMVFVFFLFFSFLELGRALGEGELFKLFFKRDSSL